MNSFSARGRPSQRPQGDHGRHASINTMPGLANSQKPIASFVPSDLAPMNLKGEPRITDVELAATYNWLDKHEPTILIPGKPPRWQPPANNPRLAEDDGVYLRDPNSARFPTFPTEPAVQAVFHQTSDFDTASIDVFACGNTLGSLLSFVQGEERTFRFGVELLGSTLFLVRRTNSVRETIPNVYGFGHTFPDAYTIWEQDVRGSVSHQRIIKYKFAGLKCLIRSESDGYLPSLLNKQQSTVTDTTSNEESAFTSDTFSSLNIEQCSTSGTHLILKEGGKLIPQHAVFDLKTRVKRRNVEVSVTDFLQRLWVNQTPNFMLAFHSHCRFAPRDIHIIDTRVKIKEWEAKNEEILTRLGALLHRLVAVAKQRNKDTFEVRRIEQGPLQLLTEETRWSALSDELKKRWQGVPEDSEQELDSNHG